MQNVIVGTAGHVDHGKTCLIKALTGTDTDRLKEEQKRGITIELGFANLTNDEGIQIGIIDVPGHEKFVKNMLAGIGGIDLVLLVVALEEGVMPQTREHFEILKMLHVKEGIVVFTKADLVDEEWAELVNEDVDRLVLGSFMENASRIRVSSHTGQNIAKLKTMIIDKVKISGIRRQDKELFRLPIDRVFTMDGFGTVVTGTLLEGCCHVGQEVEIYPQEKPVKIRGIEVHGEKVETAFAGQRTAINLVNIKKEELNRGEILAVEGSLIKSQFIDAKIQLFSKTDRQLKNGDRVHLNYGSAQTIGKVILLERDVIDAGDWAYVQMRFDLHIAIKRNDRFIIRFYSPVETFGGGIVLDVETPKHKRNQEDVIMAFKIKDMGTDLEVLERILLEESKYFLFPDALAVKLNWRKQETQEQLEALSKNKKSIRLNDGSFIHKQYFNEVAEYGDILLNQFHKENTIADGMEKEEFKSKILEHFRIAESKKGDALLAEMIKRGLAVATASAIAAAGFSANYSNELKTIRDDIISKYENAGMEMPSIDDIIADFQDKKQAKQIINDLLKKGELVKISYTSFMQKSYWEKALEALKEYAKMQPEISLGEYRDILGTSRKYAVLILEYCDAQKITKKQGDIRKLL